MKEITNTIRIMRSSIMKKSSLLILRGLLTGSLVLTELINELSFLKRKPANIIPRIFPNKDASITKYKEFKRKKVYLLAIGILSLLVIFIHIIRITDENTDPTTQPPKFKCFCSFGVKKPTKKISPQQPVVATY